MPNLGINRYNNPHSNRSIKRRAKRMAEEACKLDMSTKVMDSSDFRRHEMEVNAPLEKSEDTSFRKEKPLKETRTSAGGKQALVRGCIPLI